MILSKTIKLRWSSFIKNRYEKLGYKFTRTGDEFEVDLKDLSPNSNVHVLCKCDFCGEECYVEFSRASRQETHACKNCRYVKMRDTFKKHYPTRESREDIRKHIEDTREKNTGYCTPFHDPKIREKSHETMIERTGYDNPWKIPERKHETQVKIAESLSKNGTCRTSNLQKYLAKLLRAELNKNIDVYVVDMLVNDVVVEYDGGGHFNLGMIRNSEEEIAKKESIRDNVILEHGYKVIHIISKKDILPDDSRLIDFVNRCFDYVKQYDVVYLDLDNFKIYSNKLLQDLR